MSLARRKVVTFLRHGQALHNPRAEAARHATPPCSFEEFLRLMKEDDAFDVVRTFEHRVPVITHRHDFP